MALSSSLESPWMRCLEVEAGRVFVVKSFGATRSTRRFGVGNYSTAFGSISSTEYKQSLFQ